MDFREVGVEWPRQRVLTFDGGLEEGPGCPRAVKIAAPTPFQTPVARCTVGPTPGSMAVTLHLLARHPLHREFAAWLDGAAAGLGFSEPHRTMQKTEEGWALRLTFFDSAAAWDEGGLETTQLMGSEACACVCAVSGAWVSRDGRSWGLRVDLRALRRVRMGPGRGDWREPAALWAFGADDEDDDDAGGEAFSVAAAASRAVDVPRPAKKARFLFEDSDGE